MQEKTFNLLVGVVVALLGTLIANHPVQANEPPPEVLQALSQDLQADDLSVRLRALYRLSDIGPPAESAVPALAEVFRDDDRWIEARIAAADALGAMGAPPPARQSRP